MRTEPLKQEQGNAVRHRSGWGRQARPGGRTIKKQSRVVGNCGRLGTSQGLARTVIWNRNTEHPEC